MINYKNIGSICEFNSLPKGSSDIYLLIGSHFMDKIDIFSNIATDFDSFIERHDLLDVVTLSYEIDKKTELVNLFLSKITPTTMGVSILDEKNAAENELLHEILKGVNNKNGDKI